MQANRNMSMLWKSTHLQAIPQQSTQTHQTCGYRHTTKPVDFFYYHRTGVNFSSRNNFSILGYFAKVSIPVKIYNSLAKDISSMGGLSQLCRFTVESEKVIASCYFLHIFLLLFPIGHPSVANQPLCCRRFQRPTRRSNVEETSTDKILPSGSCRRCSNSRDLWCSQGMSYPFWWLFIKKEAEVIFCHWNLWTEGIVTQL